MSRIAFLGLGLMGSPMAERLIDAGNDVTVWNRTSQRIEPLAERAARIADSPADAVIGTEFVLTMLANPDAIEDVVFGPTGVAGAIGDAAVASGEGRLDFSSVTTTIVAQTGTLRPRSA